MAAASSSSWRWLARGLLVMALVHLVALIVAGSGPVPEPVAGAVAVAGYFAGGFLIGRSAPARAVAEPAIAGALALALVFGLQTYQGDPALAGSWAAKGGLAALALIAAAIGARAGERRQAEA